MIKSIPAHNGPGGNGGKNVNPFVTTVENGSARTEGQRQKENKVVSCQGLIDFDHGEGVSMSLEGTAFGLKKIR